MWTIHRLLLLFAALSLACGPNAFYEDGGFGTPGDAPVDRDNDGYSPPQDCNDNDPYINPGMAEDCSDGIDNNCNGGVDGDDFACVTPCDEAEESQSYFGCDFFALDLPQFYTTKIYGISVSNPSNVATANVTISTINGVVSSLVVPPRGVRTYLDASRTQNINTAGISSKAFHIVSDLPIAVYQFNSIDTLGAASTDASLLFASHSLGTRYFGMNYNSSGTNDGFLSVYATQPDTTVTITPTGSINGPTMVTIGPMEAVTVTATGAGVELTGSRIEANKPIGVFGGNACTNVPQGMFYCDHIEQQIFPRQAIGTRYIVGKMAPRPSCAVVDHIRVMADADATTVTFDPPVTGPWTLNAGEWMEATINVSVEISANNPILVGQFMRSSGGSQCNDTGDPAFVLQVPVDQFRRDYIFLTPTTYDNDIIDIMAPVGASVSLDGAAVTLNTATIGATTYTLTSMPVADGPHVVQGSEPVGVIVYAYGAPPSSQNVSYGYPAGLDLNLINPVERIRTETSPFAAGLGQGR